MQTNCPHCRTFSRVLEDVKAKYGQQVAILSVVNPPDTLDTVRQYLSKGFLTTPILFDCGQVSASYLKITPQNPQIKVPHLFIVNREGMIVNDYGYSDANKQIFEGKALFKELERLLKR
jgi:hypothetical protein